MSGFVKPDESAERALQKILKENAEKHTGEGVDYVDAVSPETKKFFEKMGMKRKLPKLGKKKAPIYW